MADFQHALAEYPGWLLVGGAVVLLALVFTLLGRILRIIGFVTFVILLVAGGWYLWLRMTAEPEPVPPELPPPAPYQTPAP